MRVNLQLKSVLHILVLSISMLLISCGNDSADDESESNDSGSTTACKYADGTHSATIDYTNPVTGYYATYTLNVEVENCEVIQIDFAKGESLNEDHITAAEIDIHGYASVEDDRGRSFEVHIDD